MFKVQSDYESSLKHFQSALVDAGPASFSKLESKFRGKTLCCGSGSGWERACVSAVVVVVLNCSSSRSGAKVWLGVAVVGRKGRAYGVAVAEVSE